MNRMIMLIWHSKDEYSFQFRTCAYSIKFFLFCKNIDYAFVSLNSQFKIMGISLLQHSLHSLKTVIQSQFLLKTVTNIAIMCIFLLCCTCMHSCRFYLLNQVALIQKNTNPTAFVILLICIQTKSRIQLVSKLICPNEY